MSIDATSGAERLVKERGRVRDLGEVFTPAATVQDMLNLLPAEMWVPHPAPTFLEPACGDGNFLVAILDRKLAAVAAAAAAGALPAGATRAGVQFHALEALASIYGVDISPENIIGGTPGHEVGARERMLAVLAEWHETQLGAPLDEDSALGRSVEWVLQRNVQVGNMLPTNPDGSPSGWETLPLCEYTWKPDDLTVTVSTTTLEAVMQVADERVNGTMTLFGAPAPTLVWTGPGNLLFDAVTGQRPARKAAR